MRLHSLFYALLGLKNIKVLEDIVNKKAREIRFKPASRAFYVITLIIFCEIMLLAFLL